MRLTGTMALLLSLSASPGAAQKTLEMPTKGIQPTWGAGVGLIFPAPSKLPSRQQCLYPMTDLPASPILIREVAFQPNAPSQFGLEAASYSITLDMSMGPLAPRQHSRAFAANLGKSVTRVFAGTIQLPKITSTTPAGWYCRIPLQSPFVANRNLGPTLVLDFSTTSVVTKMSWRWELLQGMKDVGGGGEFQGIGFNCNFYKFGMLLQFFTGSMYIGQSWSWRATPLQRNQPGFLMIGDAGWGSMWGGLRLPIDLTSFGAPKCTWDVRPALTLPFVVNQLNEGIVKNVRIPKDPRLINAKFFLQGAYASPKFNPLGLVVLPSLIVRIGSGEDTDAAALGVPNNFPPYSMGNWPINNPVPYCRITYY